MIPKIRDVSSKVIDRSSGEQTLELLQRLDTRMDVVEADGVEF